MIQEIIAKSAISSTKLGRKTTCVCLTMPNGFEIVETSACVCAENYDQKIGTDICMKRIEDRIWALEGYRLQCELGAAVKCGGAMPGCDIMSDPAIVKIARTCHEVNRAYCMSIGDFSQPEWDSAPEWQKTSAIKGVIFHIDNPEAGPSARHDEWLKEKTQQGWKYVPVKDADKKEHPCFVPYDELPENQKVKDALFIAVVHSSMK